MSRTHLTFSENNGVEVDVIARCNCGTEYEMTLRITDVNAWLNGEFVQYAFPELDKDQREMLISGTCPECWDELFSDDAR